MKTKILLAVFCLSSVLYACSNGQEEEKKQLNEILAVHDKVMGESEQGMKNKMVLDSLVKKYTGDTSKANRPALLSKQLAAADSSMEDWMHKFNADYTGKSHEEIMTYLNGQHQQLLQVDSLLSAAIKQSNDYLSDKK